MQTGLRMTRRGSTFVHSGGVPACMEVAVIPFDLLASEVGLRLAYLNPLTRERATALVASGTPELDRLVTRA